MPSGRRYTIMTVMWTRGEVAATLAAIAQGSRSWWRIESVSVETAGYNEAIVLLAEGSVFFWSEVRYAEYVLGRKYKRLTGRVVLADDSANTTPVPLVIVLDGEARVRKTITTTPLQLDVDLTGVNRVRFVLTPPGDWYEQGSKIAFVELIAEP